MIYEKAFAKINLALEVGKEIDGYHQVQNLMVPIDLYDELFFQKAERDSIECDASIDDNICLRAVKLFKEHFSITSGVFITLNKKIPIMAGLAGGSSDAAATLRGLNRLFETNASQEELYAMACKLGSDVPFFLNVQSAMCTGRGEVVTPIDLDFKNVPFLIVKPDFGLSTKEVYKNYVFHGVSKNITIQKLIEAIKMKNFDLIDEYIFNDLESTALRICPQLAEVFQKIDSLSYIPHISGSGPSIYILNAKTVDLENIKALDAKLSLFLCHTI
ncbi:MAG: 4-(cytidine 5'-diphospho)-2-C-methyl-D-erythritol kinase [Acholeplasmatales bacterium]|jgi:4-diphosphocytidyl-2-C-methyl-D-erythritol kinase|nr:4-(cytidine 5'-diphospho)-2-C-methyl-D-erythritol kinase [Acholeplasmatales bacterium]